MNKFVSVLVLGSALALSACGGDSDSSGGSYNPSPVSAICAMRGDSITVSAFGQGCSVTKPDLNKGKQFTLSCKNRENSQGEIESSFSIKTSADGDIKSIKNDIEISPFGKYNYTCNSSVPSSGL